MDQAGASEAMQSQAIAGLQELMKTEREGGDPVTTGSVESISYGEGVQDSFAYMLSEAEEMGIGQGRKELLQSLIYDPRGRLEFEIARKLSRNQPAGTAGLELRHLSGGSSGNRVPDKARAVLLYRSAPAGAGAKRGKGRGGRAKTARSLAAADAKSSETAKLSPTAAAYEKIQTLLSQYREETGHRLTSRRMGKSLEIIATGKGAFGAAPESGENAVAVLLGFLDMLDLENDDLVDFVRFYCGKGASDPLGEGLGLGCGEGEHALTVNNSMITYDRRVVRIRMDVRYPGETSEEEIYGKLTPLLDENGLGIVKLSHYEPLSEEFIEIERLNHIIDTYREVIEEFAQKDFVK